MPESLRLSEWKFFPGDIPFPEIIGHVATYAHAKTGSAGGAAGEVFADSAWQEVRVPHDFAAAQPPTSSANLSQGYRPRGIGWYRTYFRLPADWSGKNIEIEFGGISNRAIIWLNGCLLGEFTNGYLPIQLDLTPFLQESPQINVLAVRVDATDQQGWWYEGAGLYRDVLLRSRPPCHFMTDSLWSAPIKHDDGTWEIPLEIEVTNQQSITWHGQIHWRILDPDGAEWASQSHPLEMVGWHSATQRTVFFQKDPALWSPDSPVLYRIEATLIGRSSQSASNDTHGVLAPLGFRTLHFDADAGFFLNGKPFKIHGVCCHQDHAGVGVAVTESLARWRLLQLKNMGVNAYRCAHHPPARHILKLADELGLLVLNETRVFSSAPFAMDDLRRLVIRDRCHPSVFMWSIANEEFLQSSPVGVEIARRMVAAIRALDSTRPITAALNGGLFAAQHVGEVVDVVGINYQSGNYDAYHAQNTTHCLLSTEDVSGFMIRGETQTDWAAHRVSAYDDEQAPWGNNQREGWTRIAQREFIAGGFLWTGIDYHGEPSPLEWPTNSSLFGCLDLCGFPKTAYFIKKCHWLPHEPTLYLFPHWNAPAFDGAVRVLVVTNAATVELMLNGVSLGVQEVPQGDFPSWQVDYFPGRLEAVATWPDGSTQTVFHETTGPAYQIILRVESSALPRDPDHIIPVRVSVIDAVGREVPTESRRIRFHAEGNCAIIGCGNGDPNSLESETQPQRHFFQGLAQVLVAYRPTDTPEACLIAEADGLLPARLDFQLIEADAGVIPDLPLEKPVQWLKRWRLSPPFAQSPDPTFALSDSDMNSWEFIGPDTSVSLQGGCWFLLRSALSDGQSHALILPYLDFVKDCWVDGQRLEAAVISNQGIPSASKWELPAHLKFREVTLILRPETPQRLAFAFTPFSE